MNNSVNNDAGQESDIDVILEDDISETSDNGYTGTVDDESKENGESMPTGGTVKKYDKEKECSSKRSGQVDDEPILPYLPRLKTSIIQMVLNINAELIKLCKEYQNNSLMDDPQLVIYQMRLQSNLAYLASVADHYLDPTRSMPDLAPLPKPTLPSCQGSTIAAKLSHARQVYSIYANAWTDQQKELSRRAKSKLREDEKAMFANIDRENLHQHIEQLLKKDRVVYGKAGDEPINPESYKPFPPFKIPEETQLPPGLQRWSFESNVAAPDDSSK
ncbi:hypothetical protein IW140_000139 [Coemansia sp. RSA 1813]|nr:hypothetical protein EV178_000056 [Coemansia sp. RSA 1646]KAJ1772304.1 hypothetical protein LPJ74_001569 [Coemansia sp. RSA 1843]KAJ2093244.1 hypothetical protein IW138_000537 [Coemansia sp. RSA 986]KAJ2217491.1 hypothetical protein EV179_000325 [Coemansia sp. RSA 487]KAJ2573497.1 hypothetical protein IW140_000139 [Coemansia sp. RSA 1813]